jgi:RNA 2',3'-cyclic 3'-phosphodiesterase
MRLFVALELPEDVRAALTAWTPSAPGLRAVPAAQLHVTLAFLGERPEPQAARVAALLPGVGRAVAQLTLGAPLWLPARRPRVLAVAIGDGDGALAALQRDLVAGLVEAIGFAAQRRPFLAHVTVGRVRGDRDGAAAARDEPLDPPPAVGAFSAAALTLMRSRLSPHGARYEALERVVS